MIRATGVRRGWSLPSGGRGSSTTASGSESRVPTNAIRVPSGDQSGLAAPSGIELSWGGRPAPAREVEHEKLIDRTDLAYEGEAATVRRPFGRMIPARRAGRLDRLGLEQLPDDDPAAILSR